MVNQLIEQGISLRCNADGYVVGPRRQRGGNQVRHGLSNARSRFDQQVLRRRKCLSHCLCHSDLPYASLELCVQRPHEPGFRKGLNDIRI